ncbi:MAG TPA: DUF423 domain-containing protein [Oleiagrimonas sp.]|nr:DUF423 domain-containing protein [Oleiagrimonas sp.]
MLTGYASHCLIVFVEGFVRQHVLPFVIAVAGASAVLLGAWGAHGLHGVLDARHLDVWHTAVRFQFWHALALVAAALMPGRNRARRVAVWAFAVGIVLFCGSLYALALGAPSATGFVTPFGGLAFVAGWVALGVAVAGGRPS